MRSYKISVYENLLSALKIALQRNCVDVALLANSLTNSFICIPFFVISKCSSKKLGSDDCCPVAISPHNTSSIWCNLMLLLTSKNGPFYFSCPECQDALGMQSGDISNGQVSASSEWDGNHAAIQARLYFEAAHGQSRIMVS